MSDRYIYRGPSDVVRTKKGASAKKGGEITLTVAEATDLTQRGHMLEMADARKNPPKAVQEAAEETDTAE